MLVAIIKGPHFSTAQKEVKEALPFADLLEIRLDTFSDSLSSLDHFRRSLPLPVIFTLRKKSQGGECSLSASARILQIKRLMALKPDYFDIESDEGADLFSSLKEQHPHVQLIASYHDFQAMPKDLPSLLSSMPQKGVDIHKIAARAHSSLDGLFMLQFLKKAKGRVIGLAMGEKGQFVRILSFIFGNQMIYGYATRRGEEGQVSLQELKETYRVGNLNRTTSIYALLTGNVERSRGHIFHNEMFHAHKKNAIYVKIAMQENELGPFLHAAQDLSFRGMSVTMPLKEEILPYLDRVDAEAKEIRAVNTLYLDQRRWVGMNVDGKGVLDAIEDNRHVGGKRFLVLGSGGFARAIIYEAIKRKARVSVAARNEKKRQEFSSYFHIPSFDLEGIDEQLQKEGYDILVNATPNGMKPEEEVLLVHTYFPGSLIVEGVNNAETLLLKEAQKRGVACICGQELFRKQALLQQKIWP